MRSADLTTWEYVGDVFTPETFPSWGDLRGGRWAPAIEYADGEYRLYFTLQNLPGLARPNTAIGVATAPTPTGPWTDSGQPLVAPARWTPPTETEKYRTIIDAEVVTAPDGRRYLYYGGFGGGIWVRELSRDGLRTVGEEVQVATDSTYEGSFVVHRDGWYYLFLSSGHCCKGPVTSYSVFVGRSRDPMGPFVDRFGTRLDAASPGGTPVVTPNGNRWVGTGHNAVITDLAGQDWITVNGIDRENPYMTGDRGEVRRPLLVDRLDWVDGWPTVRAGAGVSETAVAAPRATGSVVDAFEETVLDDDWRGRGWTVGTEPAGGFARASADAEPLVHRRPVTGDVRARAAVRAEPGGDVGLEVGRRGGAPPAVSVQVVGGELRVETAGPSGTDRHVATLPESFDASAWHDLEVEVEGRTVTARVSDAGLFDPVAELRVVAHEPPRGPMALSGHAGDVDDVSVAPLAVPVTTAVPVPDAGALLDGDEFVGSAPGAGSTWVRGPVGEVRDGQLVMPVQADADLTGTSNSAALLLRDVADDTEWVAETRVTLDVGDGPWRGFPQAGLLVYGSDDSYVRLSAQAHRAGQIASYQKEMPWAGGTAAAAGTAGPVARTTWLRIAHRLDPANGEHELRAGTSLDGERWTWSQTHVLPAGTDLRVGLGAHGAAAGDDGAFEARFDYLRVHAHAWDG
jgi:hypothetical protein